MKNRPSPSDLVSIAAAVLTLIVSVIAVSAEFRNIASQMLKSDLFLSILASTLGAAAALFAALFFYRVNRRRPALRIFISHRHEDNAFVKKLSLDLQENGYIVFDPDVMIKAGEKITEKTEAIIKSSDLIVLVISVPEAVSQWTSRELEWAVKHGRAIIPLSLRPNPELPKVIQDLKYLVVNDENLDETMPILLQALEAHRA